MNENYTEAEMKSKWNDFESFLDELDFKYEVQLKDKGEIRNYVTYGTGDNDIKYAIDDNLPEFLQKEVLAKLRDLFPPVVPPFDTWTPQIPFTPPGRK